MAGQTIATAMQAQEIRPTVADFIERMQPEIARALPKHMDADRMTFLALTVVRKTPKLADCTPESFAGALLTAASVGLEPGVAGEAYLVPYKQECTLIVGYQGMEKLWWQHPLAAGLDAQAVCERDEFDYARGTSPFLRHKPARGDRGQVVFYYAVATLTRGEPHFEVLTPGDVKELRRGKVGPNGDIPDPMRWMERKTAVRQVLKPMPKSTMLVRALAADERPGSELFMERVSERPRMALHSAAPARNVEPSPAEPPVEDVEPEPQPPETDDVSKRQLRKLGTQFTKFGVKDREERLRIVSAITGRAVESSAELSLDEASTLIDTLDGVLAAAAKNGEDPLEQLLLIVDDQS